MTRKYGRKVSPVTQERLQRLSVYESILSILFDELFYDLDHGAQIEPGILVAMKMHEPDASHILCTKSKGRFASMAVQSTALKSKRHFSTGPGERS